MPTVDNPAAHAEVARQALQGLAHATRATHDPTQIYSVLGSLSDATASLQQALHQLAGFHDGPSRPGVSGDDRARRAASHQISWELHRAAETLRQIAAAIDHAHQIEATISYSHHSSPEPLGPHRAAPGRGLPL